MTSYEVRHYTTETGVDPFGEWVHGLRDRKAAAKISSRIDRLALGNFGDHRALDGGVYELRVDWGPGCRVYFGRVGKVILLLLRGGDKATQQKDIEHAKAYLNDYQTRTRKARPGERPS